MQNKQILYEILITNKSGKDESPKRREWCKKFDMKKAYTNGYWSFLDLTMELMSFGSR